jgi:hypothetical protein
MKTAGSENPNSHIRLCTEPSPWGGRSKLSSLIHTGWKAGKYPAAGEVFFLTFPFIELLRMCKLMYKWETNRAEPSKDDPYR